MEFPLYENEEYRMRELLQRDAYDIFTYYSDRNQMRYTATPPHQSINETEKMIAKLSSSFPNGNGIAWAIVDKRTDKVIGNIGLYYVDDCKWKAAVGYNISSPYQNKGIATWALGNCLEFGRKELKLDRIVGKCKSVNIASERVMIKCGMTLFEVKKSPFLVDGIYYDIKTYIITQ
jgi:[ribosomal protein S5]-alanine N-acetyltransferase